MSSLLRHVEIGFALRASLVATGTRDELMQYILKGMAQKQSCLRVSHVSNLHRERRGPCVVATLGHGLCGGLLTGLSLRNPLSLARHPSHL
jgi:hypothetical protein